MKLIDIPTRNGRGPPPAQKTRPDGRAGEGDGLSLPQGTAAPCGRTVCVHLEKRGKRGLIILGILATLTGYHTWKRSDEPFPNLL